MGYALFRLPHYFNKLQEAARAIEAEGIDGIRKASELVGENAAIALFLMHLRQTLASDPSDQSIDDKVVAIMTEERLVGTENLIPLE